MKVEELIENECDRLKRTLLSKNAAYGSAAFDAPDLLPDSTPGAGLLIRMGDKFRRLRALARREAGGGAETFLDTVFDLAGYCLLFIVAHKSKEDEKTEELLKKYE